VHIQCGIARKYCKSPQKISVKKIMKFLIAKLLNTDFVTTKFEIKKFVILNFVFKKCVIKKVVISKFVVMNFIIVKFVITVQGNMLSVADCIFVLLHLKRHLLYRVFTYTSPKKGGNINLKASYKSEKFCYLQIYPVCFPIHSRETNFQHSTEILPFFRARNGRHSLPVQDILFHCYVWESGRKEFL